jgi:hypothetical protein
MGELPKVCLSTWIGDLLAPGRIVILMFLLMCSESSVWSRK